MNCLFFDLRKTLELTREKILFYTRASNLVRSTKTRDKTKRLSSVLIVKFTQGLSSFILSLVRSIRHPLSSHDPFLSSLTPQRITNLYSTFVFSLL